MVSYYYNNRSVVRRFYSVIVITVAVALSALKCKSLPTSISSSSLSASGHGQSHSASQEVTSNHSNKKINIVPLHGLSEYNEIFDHSSYSYDLIRNLHNQLDSLSIEHEFHYHTSRQGFASVSYSIDDQADKLYKFIEKIEGASFHTGV